MAVADPSRHFFWMQGSSVSNMLQHLQCTWIKTVFPQVHIFCERALSRLQGTDRQLPQIRRLREMLGRGLGVHHAGRPHAPACLKTPQAYASRPSTVDINFEA